MVSGVLLTYLLLFALGCGGAVSLGIFYKCLKDKALKYLLTVFLILLFSLLRNITSVFKQEIIQIDSSLIWIRTLFGFLISLLMYGNLYRFLLELNKGNFLKAFLPTFLVLLVQIGRIVLFYFLPEDWMNALYLPSMLSISIYNVYIGLAMVKNDDKKRHYSMQKLLKWLGRITLVFTPASLIFYLFWYYLGMRQKLIISLDFVFLSLWSAVALIVLIDYLARMGQLPGYLIQSPDAAEKYGLTPREQEVLSQVMKGLTNKEIGESLFIAPVTVRTHVSRLIEKTGVRNRVELVAKLSRDT